MQMSGFFMLHPTELIRSHVARQQLPRVRSIPFLQLIRGLHPLRARRSAILAGPHSGQRLGYYDTLLCQRLYQAIRRQIHIRRRGQKASMEPLQLRSGHTLTGRLRRRPLARHFSEKRKSPQIQALRHEEPPTPQAAPAGTGYLNLSAYRYIDR